MLYTTALVHELYLRINSHREFSFEHPAQFFAYAARAMRHLLNDRAHDRPRQCAGGGWLHVTLTGVDPRVAIDSADQALNVALHRAGADRRVRRSCGRVALFCWIHARPIRRNARVDASYDRPRLAIRAHVFARCAGLIGRCQRRRNTIVFRASIPPQKSPMLNSTC